MAVDWKVWYGDGSTFSSADGGPELAPERNVQAISVPDTKVGRFTWSRADYYWWADDVGRWQAGDIFGLWDYLARPGWKRVLFGRSIPNAAFDELMAAALHDPELPPKSAWDPREHRGGPGAEPA